MVKESEYKYRLTVSRERKVSTGNYENKTYFESLSMGFDKKDELEAARQLLISEVENSINGQIELDNGFKTADEIQPTMLKPEGPSISETKVSQYINGEIVESKTDDSLWPPSLMCKNCGEMVDRKPSKYPGNPYYYKCQCGKTNYSKGYKKQGN